MWTANQHSCLFTFQKLTFDLAKVYIDIWKGTCTFEPPNMHVLTPRSSRFLNLMKYFEWFYYSSNRNVFSTENIVWKIIICWKKECLASKSARFFPCVNEEVCKVKRRRSKREQTWILIPVCLWLQMVIRLSVSIMRRFKVSSLFKSLFMLCRVQLSPAFTVHYLKFHDEIFIFSSYSTAVGCEQIYVHEFWNSG